jgi:hypothetical protein
MNEITDKSQGPPGSISSEDEHDPSAQPNIALMFELKERELERKKRRTRTAIMLFAVGALVAVVGFLFVRYAYPPAETPPDGPPGPTAPVVTAKEVREQVAGDFILRTIAVDRPGEQELTVGLYDFDANRFMRGQEVVDDPNELKRLLTERGADLKRSLLVVFAGASFDGEPGVNRNLCRRRGCYVGKMASSIPGVAANRVWVIAAGEHKSRDFAGPDEESKEEDVLGSPGGQRTLRSQRKLLLITIPLDGASGAAQGGAQGVVKTVVDALRRGALLPTDYDHGQTDPAPLADMKCEQLTP